MCDTHTGEAVEGPAAVCERGIVASLGTNPHGTLILDFVVSELWENTFLLFGTQSAVVCHGSPSRLMRCHSYAFALS